MLVRDRMSQRVVTIGPAASLADALALMGVHRIRHLPVVEGEGLVGVVAQRDVTAAIPVLWALVELFAGARGSRIEVRLPNRPGELARVVHAIGVDSRINISGVVVPPVSGQEAVAVIQVQTVDADGLVAQLRELGYSVSAALRGATQT